MTEQPSQRPASAPGPIPPPHNPLHAPNPYRDVFADLTEKVMARLDLARAADAQSRAEQGRPGATGESLEGGVEVDVDGKGLIAAVRYTGIVSGMTPTSSATTRWPPSARPRTSCRAGGSPTARSRSCTTARSP